MNERQTLWKKTQKENKKTLVSIVKREMSVTGSNTRETMYAFSDEIMSVTKSHRRIVNSKLSEKWIALTITGISILYLFVLWF